MTTGSLTLARPSSCSMVYNGKTYDLTKFLDGDYMSLQMTTGEVVKFNKGVGGNAAGAIDMQATISSAEIRILNTDPFADAILEISNQLMAADSTDLKGITIQNISFYFYTEEDGELVRRTFKAAFGSVVSTPRIRANANGDATQTVYAFTLKMPTGCKFASKEVI